MRLSRLSSPEKLFLAAVCLYLATSLVMLSHYPPLGVDEGFFGNPAYNLATKGFLGATLMSGFYGTEQRTYMASRRSGRNGSGTRVGAYSAYVESFTEL